MVVTLAAILLRPSGIARLTTAVNVVALVLVAMTLLNIVPYEWSRNTVTAARTRRVGSPRPTAAPGARDIYFLVFDRYGSNESLDDLADAHNTCRPGSRRKGFTVAEDAHANYGRTTMSLAATLNMTYLDDVVAGAGPALQRPGSRQRDAPGPQGRPVPPGPWLPVRPHRQLVRAHQDHPHRG